ncbi:MAG: hypothetical protein KKA84_16325 [Bacteroidetes bacterium]|nr:hypothetical protein [Bacteroidota bacterium]
MTKTYVKIMKKHDYPSSINESALLMWKESKGRYRFQTTSSVMKRKMQKRNRFHLTAYALNAKLWIFYCELKDVQSAMSRFKGISGRSPVYDKSEEIFY